ncbi:MAG: hypothetical protein KGL39_00870 [Patescibacteria group bacterium]|nr:hypothetical protein [Patescibacteria group bacterium]
MGNKRILIVGEAPGEQEDYRNRPFVGPAGQKLQSVLNQVGIDLRQDTWVTNSIICRPMKEGRNRAPSSKEVVYCRPNVIQAIRTLQPESIVLLGAAAVRSVIGWLWREDPGGITKWAGWKIPCQKLNTWIFPTYHPSFLLRSEGSGSDNKRGNSVLELFFSKHLQSVANTKGRPWQKAPDYKSRVQVLYNAQEAANAVHSFIGEHPVAWDIECDRLKPDSSDARIVSCSMSNGKTTISFPWLGESVSATLKFVKSRTPKIGWNQKYETRWLLARYGVLIENWVWDGMLGAHILDSRKGITSLKFQAFVRLGQDGYDAYVKPYMKSSNSNSANRIRELSLESLLVYGGQDALLEYKVGMIQAKQLGVKL